ncbi:MAG TPA: glycoside hydrolase family 5 protein [Ktedonobacteraceae bacterium]|jgi:hypothetical protein|nr:glycoside hydrolase family 5 protein [Ktedonobacteraceae bacterium]
MNRRSFLPPQKLILLLATLLLVLIAASCGPFDSNKQPTGQSSPTDQQTPAGSPDSSGLAIRVSGNQLINKNGQPIRLIGVNFPAGVSCVATGGAAGVFPAPSPTQAAAAMTNWHINAVRVTLNEDCWLGINRLNPTYSGNSYRNVIINFIKLIHSKGMYAIVDLHVNAPGATAATSQQVMADADHATDFWRSVATTFKNDPAVIFDAYNEPHIAPDNAQTTNPWQCWRDGCTITALYQGHNQPVAAAASWQALGMQGLVNAIRSTGATNPIMLGGLNWSQDLTQFLQYLPSDPQHQLIASYHNYRGPRNTEAYWNRVIAPIAEQMPVVTGEFGEKDCQTSFVSQYMNWADQHNISYLAWAWWTPTDCRALGLLSDWDGTPSAYGQVFYDHFRSVNPT